VESLGTLAVASAPPVEPGLYDEERIEANALVPNYEVLFSRELCGLLARLEAAIPRAGKEIACLLAEKTSRDKIRK
jgi:hypothetical protein